LGIFIWLVLGLAVGLIASRIVDAQGSGVAVDLVLGVIGAAIGGMCLQLSSALSITTFNLWSVLASMAGAVVVLLLWHVISGGGETVLPP
jgi:uncharacterized membrane protein YeaQ/YmgE (transglycosylase-associated protein family)